MGAQYRPERMTVAGWMEFTGESAPLGQKAREVPVDQLATQQLEEEWQVGPTTGSVAP